MKTVQSPAFQYLALSLLGLFGVHRSLPLSIELAGTVDRIDLAINWLIFSVSAVYILGFVTLAIACLLSRPKGKSRLLVPLNFVKRKVIDRLRSAWASIRQLVA
ncbi:MAG: hypothetical protein AAGE01_07525 [Pseudomonadota bacterium]